ncbi:SUR7/PalI family protein, partial [Aspergillus brunneoviolaceus CBS 621.78]|uniref:Integral membrane protein n=2 Tax=Aspergillus TaxID=5052 RepID=A0A8G1REF1_9EURO
MGKGGRIVCIFTPYVLTIASLICIIMVGLGCTKSSSSTLDNLYFFRINLQNITNGTSSTTAKITSAISDLAGVSDGDLSAALEEIEEQYNIQDFYTVGLWGYCSGNITNGNDYKTTNCSKPEAEFWFNPLEVWNLEESGLENALSSSVKKELKVYKSVSKWMFIAYIIAFIATIVELVVGVFAICSRWGSCVTTLVSAVAFLFTTAASVTSTALFAVLKGVFKAELESYGVKGQMGKNMYVATWLAVAFSLGASLFWLLSTCCCSGRSPYNHRNTARAVTAEKAPYTYEPLGPYGQPQQPAYTNTAYPPPPPPGHVPMQQNGRTNAYEPFRHV